MEKGMETIQEDLKNSFTEEYIRNFGTLVHSMAEKFYWENHLDGKVYFSDKIFENCLLDILVDISRLKYFHNIEFVNYIKLIAYSASWILKRKPFQLIEGLDQQYMYINEKFALSMLLQAAGMKDNEVGLLEEDKDKLSKDISAIFYHLKYRNTNPQTLELLLIGIDMGQLIQKL